MSRISNEPLEVFFDGACSLCTREINMLRRLDRNDRIIFTDIAAPDFDAEAQAGLSYSTLMATIHARLPDGTLITGVEVFRQLYGRVGLKSLMPLTRIPGIKQGLDVAYEKFAKNRLRLTGRCEEEGVCQVSAGEATQPG